jgi:hypothetical protein
MRVRVVFEDGNQVLGEYLIEPNEVKPGQLWKLSEISVVKTKRQKVKFFETNRLSDGLHRLESIVNRIDPFARGYDGIRLHEKGPEGS